jgi:hypothetical protein
MGLVLAIALLAIAGAAAAQSTTGTISGRVTDAQGLALPGVTVTIESPNLQGSRTAVTSENGDYILTLLPSGTYTVIYELSSFERQQRTTNLAPTQVLPINVTMSPAAVTETVTVVGASADVLLQTTQVATNFSHDLLSALPTTRDVRAVMYLAPGVHSSGPFGGFFSVGGAMSLDNLYMVNGVSINENLNGQPLLLMIEDAVQETTVATGGISAEYGRFGGGVVNVVTKSGGDSVSGSFRETLTNDHWRALVPRRQGDVFANDSKLNKVVPTHEYTLGGPILTERLWYFTAGLLQQQETNRQLLVTNIPYVFTDRTRRYEAKATFALDASHRFQGAFTRNNRDLLNNANFPSLDRNSLENRKEPADLFTISYTGVLGPSLFVEGRYAARDLTFKGSGSQFTDRIRGTVLVNTSQQRYWSPTFCAVCGVEERDNRNVFVKGSYFLSKRGAGSHIMAFGYDNFNDIRFVNNHQSGSGYRVTATTTLVRDGVVFPQIRSGTSLLGWTPIFIESQGTDFRTHSLFYNDNWRISSRLTANLGVRWDKNNGTDGSGRLVANRSAISPRLGMIWDPRGDGAWSVTGSVAKYVTGLSNRIADVTSPAGNADSYSFVYRGPDINVDPNGPLVPTDRALEQVFQWFEANGSAQGLPLNGSPVVRGVNLRIQDSLHPPHTWEYAGGVSRQVGRAALRADVMYRRFGNFYVARTDLSTGRVTDDRSFAPPTVRGRSYDLTLIENESDGLLERQYAGMTLQGQLRFGPGAEVGANYTLSRLWGNIDGEAALFGGISTDSAMPRQYPEYREARWNYPVGNLAGDQRHRARLWVNYEIPRLDGLRVTLLQALESGVPYTTAAFTGVDPRPSVVPNPGYLTPPSGQQTQYYFFARDAFRTEGMRRTDVAANYGYNATLGGRRFGLFVQAQIINLFNQYQLCGCGGSALFPLGGNIQTNLIDTTVLTSVTSPSYQTFNPFTTTPVEGVNWARGQNYGKALSRFAYTTPRTFRMTFGVRF